MGYEGPEVYLGMVSLHVIKSDNENLAPVRIPTARVCTYFAVLGPEEALERE